MTMRSTAEYAHPRRSRSVRPRRGVALLLVLISLGAAGALTSFYLISQSNSAAIGANAESASSSDWAARTGAELGLAILETEQDWRSKAATDGCIVKDKVIGRALVTISVHTLDGDPPGDDDRDLVLTSIAVVDGVSSIRQLLLDVRPNATAEESFDEELSEFGVYAINGIEVDNESLITVWSRNPRNRVNVSGNIGAGFALDSAFRVDDSSAIQRSALFVMNSASSGLRDLVEHVSSGEGGVIPIDALPVASALAPSAFGGLPDVTPEDMELSVATSLRADSGRWRSLRCSGGAEVVLNDDGAGLYQFDDLQIEDGALLTIDGHVEALVSGAFKVREGAAVQLANDASSLKLYLMGDLHVDGAGIGVDPAIADGVDVYAAQVEQYTSPLRMRIYGVSPASGGEAEPTYEITDGAIVLASIHAPTADVIISNESILIGRSTSDQLRVTGSSEMHCDPTLGVSTGLTDFEGPLYTEEGEFIEELLCAFDSWDASQGLGALEEELVDLLGVDDAVSGLLGQLGLSGLNPTDGDENELRVTHRVAARVLRREWPMRAFAMESLNRPVNAPDGYSAEPGHNDDGSFFDPDAENDFQDMLEGHFTEHASVGGG